MTNPPSVTTPDDAALDAMVAWAPRVQSRLRDGWYLNAAHYVGQLADALTALRAQLRLANIDAANNEAEANDLRAKLAAAAAELAEARKDSQRLDWWEKNPRLVSYSFGFLSSLGCWSWKDRSHTVREATSLRVAIDAAREGGARLQHTHNRGPHDHTDPTQPGR